MFKRFLLILLFLIFSCSVFAGELENALKNGNNVFLYLYTPDCGYCTKFTPRYNKLSKMYDKSYKFIKIDASTPYGYSILKKFGARFVPFVVLMNPKKNVNKLITPSCLMDGVCTEQALQKFLK